MKKNKTEDYDFALQVFECELGRPADINNAQDKATIGILAIGIRYGRSGVLLTRPDLDALHDVLYNLSDITYTDEQLYTIWKEIPQHLKDDATHWGMNDTVVRDNIYGWAKKNITFEETTTQS